MKKFLSVLLVAVLALSLSVAAFAADSPVEMPAGPDGCEEIWGPEGGKAEVIAPAMPESAMASQAQADVPAGNKISDMETIGTYEITVPEGTEFPVEIRFVFAEKLATNEMAFVYHWNGEVWECVGKAFPGASEITGTFKSLSPVQIVKGVLNKGAAPVGSSSSASTGATSPNTGVDSVIVYAMIAILMSGAVIFATRKKEA